MAQSLRDRFKHSFISKRFQVWLKNIPISDPIERSQAYLFQIMLLFLICIAILTIPVGIFLSKNQLGGLVTSIASIIASISFILALIILRKGRFRKSVIITATGLMLSFSNTLIIEGLRTSGWLVSAFMIPITLSGLLTGRKGVLIISGISIGIIATTGTIQLTTTGIIGNYPREGDIIPIIMSTFIASVIISTFLFHRFAASLRDALTNALERERELKRIRDHLEDTVKERTAELQEKNEDLHQGLVLAHDIQLGLLPQRPPWDPEAVEVSAHSVAAFEVGGDFYTYIPTHHEGGMIAIGDISGKGVGAALMMALTMSALESEARIEQRPAALLDALNHFLTPKLQANTMNAAIALVIINQETVSVQIANAGMIAPILIRNKAIQYLDVAGFPVGSANLPYRDIQIPFETDDLFLLVSDGVVEAHNKTKELYGFERLEACLGDIVETSVDLKHLISKIMDDIRQFIDTAEQHDDITIVAIRPCISLPYGAA